MRNEIDEQEARENREYERDQRMKEAARNAIERAGLELDPDETYPFYVDGDLIEVTVWAAGGIPLDALNKLSQMVREISISGTRKNYVVNVYFKLLE